MARDRTVLDAIDRWIERGLISADLGATLRAEVREGEAGRLRRTAQYAIATAGGLVLLLAGAIFVGRGWSDLSDHARTFLLGGIGVGLSFGGALMERRPRLRPGGYLLQAVGLVFLLIAYVYSDRVWESGTAGAMVIGVLALLTPIVSAMRSWDENPVMPAINTAFGYVFVTVFLDRVGLDPDAIVWVLDGLMVLSLLVFGSRLARADEDTPGTAPALYAFITSLFAGLVLVGFTAAGPFDMRGSTIFALDLWLLVIIALELWAVHRAPDWLQRAWYDDLMAATLLLAAVFASITLDQLGVDSDWVGLGGVAVGAIGIAYGLRLPSRSVLMAGCLAVVIGVWHFGISFGETLGAIGALAVTGALLFWVSAQLGRGVDEDWDA